MSAKETLPDFIAPRLQILSIGLNPSLPSVDAGFYFANPRNRFWAAFAASGLVQDHETPSPAYHRRLLKLDQIGFTDVVKRPSRQGHMLNAADFRRDAPLLAQKIHKYNPSWAWFHGKVAYQKFLHYALKMPKSDLTWGLQTLVLGATRIFVTPNPSPANAVYSLADLQDWYRQFQAHVQT